MSKQYKLVISDESGVKEFETQVNALLADGWVCQGGVHTLTKDTAQHFMRFAQAMVYDDSAEEAEALAEMERELEEERKREALAKAKKAEEDARTEMEDLSEFLSDQQKQTAMDMAMMFKKYRNKE